MTRTLTSSQITDETLAAHLDGELPHDQKAIVARALDADPGLRARRDLLASGERPFAQAFDSLLPAAPHSLNRDIARYLAEQTASSARDHALLDRRSIVAAAASAAVLAPAAFLLGRRTRPDMDNWREAVAQYHKLYSDRTLAGIADNPPGGEQELARVGGDLGLKLSMAWLHAPGVAYRRAQILRVDAVPLAQIALATPDGKALAYCIRRMDAPAQEPQLESRAGLPILHWIAGGYGFLVVGPVSGDDVTRIGTALHRNSMQRI
jgi:anti-sigma factor RsiW